MRLQIIYQNNKGFLLVEIMLGFSIFILFFISTSALVLSMQRLKIWSINELNIIASSTKNIDARNSLHHKIYGNDSEILSNDLFSISQSDYMNAWGRDSCNIRIKFDADNLQYSSQGVNIGESNPSTDIEVRNNIVYLTADSAVSFLSDFFIIDSNNSINPQIISSINTGPGVAGLEVAGPYAFLAQSSTVNQLQILDIHNRSLPKLVSQLKLSLPTPTTTAPFATSIFYYKNYVYLGTTKWNGAELSIIDVSNILNPYVVGMFETNTLINDIYVRENTAYLASSDDKGNRY